MSTQSVGLGDGGALTGCLLCVLVTGCPRLALQYLHRPHALGAWEGFPLAAAGQLEAEAAPDEETVAASDPCAGLLQMQVCFLICQRGFGVYGFRVLALRV